MPVFAVEVCSADNSYWIFPPAQMRLRGHFSAAAVAHVNKTSDALRRLLSEVHDIPGIVIRVDSERMRGEILDPLASTPEGTKLLARINEIFAGNPGDFPASQRGWDSVPQELTNNTLKDWLYWMRRGIESGVAKLIGQTPLPSLEQIQAMPGKRIADPLYTGQSTGEAPGGQYGLNKYTDEVPLDAQLAGSGAGASGGGRGRRGGENKGGEGNDPSLV